MRYLKYIIAIASALYLSTAGSAQTADLAKTLNYIQEGGRLFTGKVGKAPVHAVLWRGDQENTINGYYFYDKFYKPDEAGGYTFRQIDLSGTIDNKPPLSITLKLTEMVDDKTTGSMEATITAEQTKFIGKWTNDKKTKQLSFELTPGGRLPIYTSQNVELLQTMDRIELVFNGDTRFGVKDFSLPHGDSDCEDCEEEFESFEILPGDPKVLAIQKNYSGGRVESYSTTYIVEGATEPFLQADSGGGHSCAGADGGSGDYSVSYEPPYFNLATTSHSWDLCHTEDGYYQDTFVAHSTRYLIKVDGSNTNAIEDVSARTLYTSYVLSEPSETAFYIELKDNNLFWGGYDNSGKTYVVTQFGGNNPDFGYHCWIYGSGNGVSGTPSREKIDPVWRNLSLEEAWNNFKNGTPNGLFSTKSWKLKIDGDAATLLLNLNAVARYNLKDNRCYSLYLKEDTAEAGKLISPPL